jgi:hypothetical protein
MRILEGTRYVKHVKQAYVHVRIGSIHSREFVVGRDQKKKKPDEWKLNSTRVTAQ